MLHSILGKERSLEHYNSDSLIINNIRCKLKMPSPGITVQNRSASLVMPNSYPRYGIFNPHLTTIIDSFFFLHTLLSTTAFRLEYVIFYQLHTITTFSSRNCSVRLLSKKLTSKRLAQTVYVKTSKLASLSHARGRLIRRQYPKQVKIVENLVRYEEIFVSLQ